MAQLQSGRTHKLPEQDSRVLKCVARKNSLSSVATLLSSLLSSKLPLEATSAQELFVWSFTKWVFMAERPHTSLRSPCAMPSVSWSGVKLAANVLWSSGN